ncbi:MAG: hypothetical protein D6766_12450 [Verrucomicrobia bacterium]|nr:MAG: hypothetical protein D6766_12450 [Verrucomicrobiota bacterium]
MPANSFSSATMQRALTLALWLALGPASMTPAARAADEATLLATLQNPAASVPERCAACVELRVSGTTNAVPALAALLTDERLGHAARYALEGMPFAEAAAALREALGRTRGPLRAGIVDSLGWRRDTAAVPRIVPLLTEGDDTEADAAAAALGRIGTAEALAALRQVRLKVGPERRAAIEEALLAIAERRADDEATALFGQLFETPGAEPVRIAAWQGLVRAEPARRPARLLQALQGTDTHLRQAALGLLRELADPAVLRAALNRWPGLDSPARQAVVETFLAANRPGLAAESRAALERAAADPDPAVRMAVWRGLNVLPDPGLLRPLVSAAASGDPAEQKAAREALARLRGPDVAKELLRRLDRTRHDEERVVLIAALGERGERGAVPVLLRHARRGSAPVRVAALEALARLRPPEAFDPLLEVAAGAREDAVVGAALKALLAVANARPDKAEADRRLAAFWREANPATKQRLLPVLAGVGGPEGLRALLTAARGREDELARAALRELARWPTAEPAPALLELARLADDATRRTLALRAAIGLAGRIDDPAARLDLLQETLFLAERPEEQKLALAELARVPKEDALITALSLLDEPALVDEAALAAVSIAEELVKQEPELGAEVAEAVLARCRQPAILRRAWALRGSARPRDFLRRWQVAGPFRREGVEGALALFNVPFPPESGRGPVAWRDAPEADVLDLAGLFPGAVHCVAYLRTEIVAPRDLDGFLLAGSDDGLRVWLDGREVLASNVDRGLVPDQDIAPVRLSAGVHRLLVKVTQGGGGWAVCLRLVGKDGEPVPGIENRLPRSTN